jgi:hypothetical protein
MGAISCDNSSINDMVGVLIEHLTKNMLQYIHEIEI